MQITRLAVRAIAETRINLEVGMCEQEGCSCCACLAVIMQLSEARGKLGELNGLAIHVNQGLFTKIPPLGLGFASSCATCRPSHQCAIAIICVPAEAAASSVH